MEVDNSKLKITNISLWEKIWIATIIVFSVGLGLFVLGEISGKEIDTPKVLAIYFAICVAYGAASYVVCRVIKHLIDATKDKKISTFWKIIILQFLALIFIVILYYITSPYQNCMRQNLYKGFCIEKTRW